MHVKLDVAKVITPIFEGKSVESHLLERPVLGCKTEMERVKKRPMGFELISSRDVQKQLYKVATL